MKIGQIPPQPQWGGHISTASYALGYVLSLAITGAAFFLVYEKFISGYWLGGALLALATLQAWVQLSCFIKLGKEESPRWSLISFFFMVFILLLVVIGSLVIMANLNYRMMI